MIDTSVKQSRGGGKREGKLPKSSNEIGRSVSSYQVVWRHALTSQLRYVTLLNRPFATVESTSDRVYLK